MNRSRSASWLLASLIACAACHKRVEFVGHGSCTGQWQGGHFSCPVQQFDPRCTYPDALFVIDTAFDGGAPGEIAAGVPIDFASSARCARQ